ncbi:toxin-antitoxin system TumE family protein [Thiobacillus sp.]
MKAVLSHQFRQAYGKGRIEGVIRRVPAPVPPAEHGYKYRLAYVVNGARIVGYDNERGKGDHRHIGTREMPYPFVDVPALLRDFLKDVEEAQ